MRIPWLKFKLSEYMYFNVAAQILATQVLMVKLVEVELELLQIYICMWIYV